MSSLREAMHEARYSCSQYDWAGVRQFVFDERLDSAIDKIDRIAALESALSAAETELAVTRRALVMSNAIGEGAYRRKCAAEDECNKWIEACEVLDANNASLYAERDALRAALADLHSVVIDQNRLGASWHESVFARLMTALANASTAVDNARKGRE